MVSGYMVDKLSTPMMNPVMSPMENSVMTDMLFFFSLVLTMLMLMLGTIPLFMDLEKLQVKLLLVTWFARMEASHRKLEL